MSLILFGKKITGHWTRETRRELRIHTQHTADIPDGKDTREMFDQVYLIYHAKGGTVYRFAPFMDNPERDDYPLAVLGDGFTKGKGGTGPKSYSVNLCQVEYADGFKEWQSCTISEPQEHAVNSVQNTDGNELLRIEELCLDACRHSRWDSFDKPPSMTDFYNQYVIGMKTAKEIAKDFGCHEKTISQQRKQDLESHIAATYNLSVDLRDLQKSKALKQARNEKEHAAKAIRSAKSGYETNSFSSYNRAQAEEYNRNRHRE